MREDVLHWHRTAREACAVLPGSYEKYKDWCDRYFFLPHRNEARGVGGLFFDDLNAPSFASCFEFARAVGDAFLKAWLPIAERRRGTPFGERERAFQLLRRGRYVEFNLVYDRGTLFGLQTGGRTESILMSLPPLVRWEYGYEPAPGSAEAGLRRLAAPARLARRGVKYRHAFHAGNFADVMKHAALVAVLARLTEKDRPLFLLDTHAGRGRFDLADAGREAERGIARVAAAGIEAAHPALARYLAIVRGLNGDGPIRAYPGSPLIEAAFMRPGDRAAFCELQEPEAAALRREFRGDARVGVHVRDGYEALGALLPPAETRGLALIDPPYEETDADFTRVAEALLAAAARWPQGVLMAWYPIKLGAVAARLHRRLVAAGAKRVLVAELCVHPDDSRAGLNGSGIVTINPPWRFDGGPAGRSCRPCTPRSQRRGQGALGVALARRAMNAGPSGAAVHGVEYLAGDASRSRTS